MFLRRFVRPAHLTGRRWKSSSTTTVTPPTATTAVSTAELTVSPHEDTVVIKSETASPPMNADAVSPEALAKLTPAYVTSLVPETMMTQRRARIYRPAKNAMQSGTSETRYWQLDFDQLDKWENPLMGWASSGDAVQAMRLRFHHREEAIQFAEKQGWDYIVQEDQQPVFKGKSYSDNYKYVPGKLRIAKTK